MTFPDLLDRNRPIYFAMDHTSSKDQTICNTIVNRLKNNGFNVVKSSIGPNAMYQNMVYVYNQGLTNAIMFHLFNGVDPASIREVATNGNDNRGKTTRSRGNDVVLAWFYDACDFTRTDGTCYESVRDSETNTGRLYNPLQYTKDNKIYVINQSSNNKNNPERADYTGEKIADSFMALFSTSTNTDTGNSNGETDDNTTDTSTTTSSGTKTITSKITTKTYTSPFYEKIYKLKTDPNGAFNILHKLPYKGEYHVTIKYGGDKTHNSTTRTIKIQNYSNNSVIFGEQLVQVVTVTKYSDGTVDTKTSGSEPNNKHLKKVITTDTYENGIVKESSTKTLYLDEVIKEKEIDFTGEITDYDDDSNYEENPTEDEPANPFLQMIATKSDGTPNVEIMSTDGIKYQMLDTSKVYILSKDDYRAVMKRDSQTLQINEYKPSRYTMFESDIDTFTVLKREQWNIIEEAIMYYLVANSSRTYPESVVVDYPNKKVICDGTSVSFKNNSNECLIHWVADDQLWNYTCGPTSCSVCSQVLHNYYSEKEMKELGKVYSPAAPATLASILNKKEFTASVITGSYKSTAISELKEGRPFIWHIQGHYLCLTTRNSGNGNVLVSNSATSDTYTLNGKLSTGWHSENNVSSAYGGMVRVSLAWTLSVSELEMLENFLSSMGGSWNRPDTGEALRWVRES